VARAQPLANAEHLLDRLAPRSQGGTKATPRLFFVIADETRLAWVPLKSEGKGLMISASREFRADREG
jgi:hypothetical protein